MRQTGHVASLGNRKMHLENLSVEGRVILKWILKNLDGVTWTEFIWLRTDISGGLLAIRYQTVRLLKRGQLFDRLRKH
jgi:hypothetical protein